MMSKLFESITIRNITIRNRIWVSPMCQYSSENGMPTDWHLVHLGSRAVGGAGLVMMEATAVSPEGRISPSDAGIWSEAHAEAYQRISKFIHSQGAVPAIQLAHAGRKASTARPWEGGKKVDIENGGWHVIAPSTLAFADTYPTPRAMTIEDITRVTNDFVVAAQRSLIAGFEVIELHMAHGYLMHEFLSPLSNARTDEHGGSLENRMRLPLTIAREVRSVVPNDVPLFVRISATDWAEGGWDLAQAIEFCRRLKEIGIDLIDVSSGGNVKHQQIPVAPNFQVPFAKEIRAQVGIATGAVGLITEAKQAEAILQNGEADAIFMAREFLRDPYFPFRAAQELNASAAIPNQYLRAFA